MICAQDGLESGGGYLVWAPLRGTPVHEEAVGYSSIYSEYEHSLITSYSAAIIVIGNVQSLVETAFYSPSLTIALQPFLSIQTFWGCAGDEGYLLVFAPLSLTQKPGGLAGKRETNIFGTYPAGANGAAFLSPFIFLRGAGLCWRRLGRGGNPLQERLLSFAHFPRGLVDFF